MTGKEISATVTDPRRAGAVGAIWRASSRPPLPVPVTRIEDDAIIPDDDDPWFDDEDLDEEGLADQPKRPFWNR
jgi:hypothetical protein